MKNKTYFTKLTNNANIKLHIRIILFIFSIKIHLVNSLSFLECFAKSLISLYLSYHNDNKYALYKN